MEEERNERKKVGDAVVVLLREMMDQDKAKILIPGMGNSSGFWFGGGNIVEENNSLYICGRYRNPGDSRTGTQAGERGLECAVFKSEDVGQSWTKVRSWTKQELGSALGIKIVSIEGTLLHKVELKEGKYYWELFISSEKQEEYPQDLKDDQKLGTGIWSIESIQGQTIETLDVNTIQSCIKTSDPRYLHVKDPAAIYSIPSQDPTQPPQDVLIFCTHPYTWSCTNSAYAIRKSPNIPFEVQSWDFASKGPVWDIAAVRVTERFVLPSPLSHYTVLLYDGAECLRKHEGATKIKGYSCEEVGGAFLLPTAERSLLKDDSKVEKLSLYKPLFVSPHGTGTSRYVKVLKTHDGGLWVVWQQSQKDYSQPLVGRFLAPDELSRYISTLH